MRRSWMAVALASALAGIGCERGGEGAEQGRLEEVEQAVEDLRQAQQEAPQRVEELREELNAAEQRAGELQEQLARAELGDTEDVRREREELARALDEQEATVTQETDEAAALAREHNVEAEEARRALEQGQRVEDVEAQVETTAEVTTDPGAPVEEQRVEREIGVERTHVEQRAER